MQEPMRSHELAAMIRALLEPLDSIAEVAEGVVGVTAPPELPRTVLQVRTQGGRAFVVEVVDVVEDVEGAAL